MTLDRAKKIYVAAETEGLLIEEDFLRRYVTGFYSTDGFVTITRKGCTLVVDSRYSEAAQAALKGSGIKVVEGGYGEAKALLEGCKRIGVPYAFTSLAAAERYKKSRFSLTDCMPAFKAVMQVKSKAELNLIQQACDIAEGAFLKLLPEIHEGMRESEAAALLEYNMRSLGAEGTSFDTIVAFGAGSSVPHHETGETRLKFGDPVLIDFGCKVKGYCSDITRTFLFGDDRKHGEFKKMYEKVLCAHELVKEKGRAGMTGKAIDAIARDYFEKEGLAQYFTHSLGHGIGLQIHEYPAVSPKGEEKITNGMVFSDEPGLYFKGNFGIRIEDSCYMQGGRIQSFMGKTERNLIIL